MEIMSPIAIASIVFVCIFCSMLLGSFIRAVLPDYLLSKMLVSSDPLRNALTHLGR
jgi:hypothetical protein